MQFFLINVSKTKNSITVSIAIGDFKCNDFTKLICYPYSIIVLSSYAVYKVIWAHKTKQIVTVDHT